MRENWSNSYLFGANADFIEELYEKYLDNPDSLAPKWKKYFDSLQDGGKKDIPQGIVKEKFSLITQKPTFASSSGEINHSQANVWQLIEAYRVMGMDFTALDPLERAVKTRPALLDLAHYGLHNELDNEFYPDIEIENSKKMKLKDIVAKFDAVYCGKVSFEFKHISDLPEQEWLTSYVENKYLNYKLSNEERVQLLQKLTEAEGLERYLHTKYVGQKRFSIEGGESLIAALDRIINMGAKAGVNEVHIGMAHRGRLNGLVNIAGKAPKKIFDEFDGNYPKYNFVTSGDVKYHKGYKCNYITPNGKVKTSIIYNPSHLEVVNAVLNGVVRAKQDKLEDNKSSILGILVHGDSALIGLGTNQGVLNMSQTRAYGVQGMIHIVVNNQVGFTTSDVRDNRSSRYCTDIAKMIESPIIHVNADDLDSVAFVMDLAVEYRSKFKRDIMLDLVCFRRHGHNEADDPTLTQPLMYRKVKVHPGTRKLYADRLISDGVLEQAQVDGMLEEYRLGLNNGEHVKANLMEALPWYDTFDITPVLNAKPNDKVKTSIDKNQIDLITNVVTTLPNEKFKPHPTLAKLLDTRKAMGGGTQLIDYGMAETLAYGSLLQDGISIRISGEDSARGTFSHRQAVWHDFSRENLSDTGYIPLLKLQKDSRFYLYDSVLNEECVLGFEYGYGITNLRDLVIWEAQFGDFANSAQVMIDQFIASGEAKWGQLTNVVLMLPHGYDGQGPEHSSARLERFLQLCAENNMQVVIPSTAGQMFHLLRHKALTNWIKPLVIIMSKRLLRLKDAASNIEDLTNGIFKTVIGDEKTSVNVDKVVVCSGQIYYDLVAERAKRKLENNVAILRIEQLYPFPLDILKTELAKYTRANKFIWAQEEPHNQGAWMQIRDCLDMALGDKARFIEVSRPSAAATACGTMSMHAEQLKQILNEIFSS